MRKHDAVSPNSLRRWTRFRGLQRFPDDRPEWIVIFLYQGCSCGLDVRNLPTLGALIDQERSSRLCGEQVVHQFDGPGVAFAKWMNREELPPEFGTRRHKKPRHPLGQGPGAARALRVRMPPSTGPKIAPPAKSHRAC